MDPNLSSPRHIIVKICRDQKNILEKKKDNYKSCKRLKKKLCVKEIHYWISCKLISVEATKKNWHYIFKLLSRKKSIQEHFILRGNESGWEEALRAFQRSNNRTNLSPQNQTYKRY